MVIGRDFAWGHMGKTGGDATHTLFQCVPDLVEFAHDTKDPAKHFTFSQMEVDDRRLILNMRRLPSVTLSYVRHVYENGIKAKPAGTRLTPEEAIAAGVPDRTLGRFTAQGELHISRWLRMEALREDFLDFVWELRDLTDDEVRAIREVPTKAPMNYDHDPMNFFSKAQIEQLYARNPQWAEAEEKVYGALMVPPSTSIVVPKTTRT